MVEVKMSVDLLKDFDELNKKFTWFMTMQLLKADEGLDAKAKAKIKELISFSVEESKKLSSLFKDPLLNFAKENQKRLTNNLNSFIKFFYEYLGYAEPILKSYKPQIYDGSFKDLKDRYSRFVNMYLK